MSLVPVTVNVERDTETDDGYGGVTASSVTVYSALQAWLNYSTAQANIRAEAGAATAQGPGVVTRYLGVVKFEPKPAITVRENDRVYVPATGERHKVVGVRSYEFTLQLDVERLT
jgi:hypothetical protein